MKYFSIKVGIILYSKSESIQHFLCVKQQLLRNYYSTIILLRFKSKDMKFVIAVVMLALAVGVNSSYLYPGLYQGLLGGHGYYGGPAAVTAWGAPGLVGGYPGISLSQGPYGHGIAAPIVAPVAAPLALGHGHEGVYVAKTRGAVHTAPLPGHINSATSVNLAPAPGTW